MRASKLSTAELTRVTTNTSWSSPSEPLWMICAASAERMCVFPAPGTAAIPNRPPRYLNISCWERRGVKLFILLIVPQFYTRQVDFRTFELVSGLLRSCHLHSIWRLGRRVQRKIPLHRVRSEGCLRDLLRLVAGSLDY